MNDAAIDIPVLGEDHALLPLAGLCSHCMVRTGSGSLAQEDPATNPARGALHLREFFCGATTAASEISLLMPRRCMSKNFFTR